MNSQSNTSIHPSIHRPLDIHKDDNRTDTTATTALVDIMLMI
jgi:hypothetical protein